jgi:hypothetical protein
MGGHKQRTENNCLNCNAIVEHRFCGICGQENVELKESVWAFGNHIFQDFTHYDGKFFNSVLRLILKPGRVAYDYCLGKRQIFINPIRLYLFSSALFFLAFFYFFNIADKFKNTKVTVNGKIDASNVKAAVDAMRSDILSDLENDTANATLKSKLVYVDGALDYLQKKDTLIAIKLVDSFLKQKADDMALGLNTSDKKYATIESYDSAQLKLPLAERDNWFERRLRKNLIQARANYKNNTGGLKYALVNEITHHFPKMLFFSLPIIALILKLIYIRNKKYYYVQHAIFATYMYCTFFIALLLGIVANKVATYFGCSIADTLVGAFSLWSLWYIFRSMHVFYGQSKRKTIVKYIILNCVMFFVMTGLFTAFVLLTLLNVK